MPSKRQSKMDKKNNSPTLKDSFKVSLHPSPPSIEFLYYKKKFKLRNCSIILTNIFTTELNVKRKRRILKEELMSNESEPEKSPTDCEMDSDSDYNDIKIEKQSNSSADSDSDFEVTLEDTRRKKRKLKNETKKVVFRYTCDFPKCKMRVQTKSLLGEHKEQVHGVPNPYKNGRRILLRCNLCEIKFSTLSQVELHEETHKIEKPFKCSFCFKRFQRKDKCNEHEGIHTYRYKCTYPKCLEKFTRRDKLNEHQKKIHIHHSTLVKRPPSDNRVVEESKCKSKKFNCPLCKPLRTFSVIATLRNHISQSHPNHLPFTCSHENCSKKFGLDHYLQLHIKRVHSNHFGRICEQGFHCTFSGCTKAYTTRKYLQIHMRSHVGDYRYVCEFKKCGKKFLDKPRLRQHMLSHSEGGKFKCSKCKYSSHWKTNLRTHLKSNHGIQVAPKFKSRRVKPIVAAAAVCDQVKLKQTRHKLRLRNRELDKLSEDESGCEIKEDGHSDESKKLYCCTVDDCQESFVQGNALRRHMKSHGDSDGRLKVIEMRDEHRDELEIKQEIIKTEDGDGESENSNWPTEMVRNSDVISCDRVVKEENFEETWSPSIETERWIHGDKGGDFKFKQEIESQMELSQI